MQPAVTCDWGFALTFFSDSLRKNQVPGDLASNGRAGGLFHREPQPAWMSTLASGQQAGRALAAKGTFPPPVPVVEPGVPWLDGEGIAKDDP